MGQTTFKVQDEFASMGKLGFDIVASHLSAKDMQFAKEAVGSYHSFKNIIWHGDLFRAVDPHKMQ